MTKPTCEASSCGFDPVTSIPSIISEPESEPPVKCGARPFKILSNVDLPLPVAPQTSENSPGRNSRFTLERAGLSVPAYPKLTSRRAIMKTTLGLPQLARVQPKSKSMHQISATSLARIWS